ncbi:ubiquitin-like domain-containing protein [Virgibacillus sp. C22-A2]|uniref:Ubiquitin-like domain-containing protein n=1 Tax=Virgibacillus tibetensis TaxID=3042313 RepID=A0ABU6KL40_9BACI|nr:ubiquitin-like domain-containing protein [Virgibacillus sp. C22-A2]
MRLIHRLMPASKMKLVISSIGVLALVVFSSVVLFEASKAEVVITDNGETQTVKTHTNTVEGLLAEVGITVGEHDELSYDKDAPIEDGMELKYDTAKQVLVTIDGAKQEYFTTSATVEGFLKENNLSFADHDEISHTDKEAVEDGLHIEVNQAYKITIIDGGEKKMVWTTGGSVEEILNSNEIMVNKKLDKIEPAIDQDVTKDTAISIVRVEVANDEVEEKIAFDTERKNDSSLLKGKEEVISEGQEGILVKKFEVTFENGKEVSRELVKEEVASESKDQVVAVGTKEEPKPQPKQEQNLVTLSSESQSSGSTKSESSNTSSGGKEYTMTASAYTASCSGCSGYTATGINLIANPNMKVIAVDPSVIPLGTKVWVEGYGEAIASDTGGHIVGNRIDIHVPTKAEAYKWGVKKVKVRIIN